VRSLLEKRFGQATRRMTAIVFLATRGLADSVRVFATAIPVAGQLSRCREPRYLQVIEVGRCRIDGAAS